jgi:hypothetical protein
MMTANTLSGTTRLRRSREVLTSVGPVVLAFLASQHHALHMLLLTFGVGTAGMSFLTMYPALRRVMLAASLGIAGLAAYRALRGGQPRSVRVLHTLSLVATLAVVGWSVGELGL